VRVHVHVSGVKQHQTLAAVQSLHKLLVSFQTASSFFLVSPATLSSSTTQLDMSCCKIIFGVMFALLCAQLMLSIIGNTFDKERSVLFYQKYESKLTRFIIEKYFVLVDAATKFDRNPCYYLLCM
jgi:hypothetical protein